MSKIETAGVSYRAKDGGGMEMVLEYNGKIKTLSGWMAETGRGRSTIYRCLKLGRSVEHSLYPAHIEYKPVGEPESLRDVLIMSWRRRSNAKLGVHSEYYWGVA